MRKIILVIIAILAYYTYTSLHASTSCIDNSKYLQERYDNKEYHNVECYCNCADTLARCPYCDHLHEAHPFTIISASHRALTAPAPKDKKIETDPFVLFKQRVQEYKKETSSFSHQK